MIKSWHFWRQFHQRPEKKKKKICCLIQCSRLGRSSTASWRSDHPMIWGDDLVFPGLVAGTHNLQSFIVVYHEIRGNKRLIPTYFQSWQWFRYRLIWRWAALLAPLWRTWRQGLSNSLFCWCPQLSTGKADAQQMPLRGWFWSWCHWIRCLLNTNHETMRVEPHQVLVLLYVWSLLASFGRQHSMRFFLLFVCAASRSRAMLYDSHLDHVVCTFTNFQFWAL